jgi:hypothetical protein
MKIFRNLRVFALLLAVLALVLGFTVLHAPKTAQASGACCYWVCTIEGPPVCWHVCRPCPPYPPPP